MITPKCKIASTEFVQSITRVPMNEDSQPADRVSMGFDAVLAQLQELVSTLSDRVERGEAVIERIEQALEGIVDDGNEEEFKAAMEYSGDFHDAVDLVETGSVTKLSDESLSNRMDEAIGYHYMDSMGFNAMSNIEEYFDYEAYGRDIRIEYYPVEAGDPETAGEYWCGDDRADDEEIGREVVNQLGWESVGRENMERYFDYGAFGRDLQMDLTFVQTDDGIFEIR